MSCLTIAHITVPVVLAFLYIYFTLLLGRLCSTVESYSVALYCASMLVLGLFCTLWAVYLLAVQSSTRLRDLSVC